MEQEDWSAEFTYRIGQEVRKHRNRQKLSAQKLADRCAELGVPIDRSVLAGLENRKRAKISLAEILVLAMALDVAPIILIFPVGDVEEVQMLPGMTASPFGGAKWFSGYEYHVSDECEDLYLPHDWWKYLDSVQNLNAYRQHERLVERMIIVYEELHPKPRYSSFLKRGEMTPEQIAQRTDYLERSGGLLRERRNDMRAKGMLLPPLRAELEEYLSGPGHIEQLQRPGWGSSGRSALDNEADPN